MKLSTQRDERRGLTDHGFAATCVCVDPSVRTGRCLI
jgi:hypothetical protein